MLHNTSTKLDNRRPNQLSIPSRMLLKVRRYGFGGIWIIFQFLLGCFANLMELGMPQDMALSIPSRMLHWWYWGSCNASLTRLSIPSRMLLRVLEGQIQALFSFQFLLGCFIYVRLEMYKVSNGTFQFLLGCFCLSQTRAILTKKSTFNSF